jgi:hypothetical protein
MVSELEPVTAVSTLTSMVPSAGGALLAWYTLDDMPMATYRTRALGFDATFRASIQTHLSFPTTGGVYTNLMSLTGSGCTFAGLADDPQNGCRFVPLDENGGETGPVATLFPGGTDCADLGLGSAGFTFMKTTGAGAAAIDLVSVSATGSAASALPIPLAEAAYGGRLVLHDSSFLVASFMETDAGGNAASVQRFSAIGAPLGSAFPLSDTTESLIVMAETGTGVLAAWLGFDPTLPSGLAIFARALDADGQPLGAAGPVSGPGKDRLYGFTMARTPVGDVILAFYELDEADRYHLFVMALGPDAAPRGAPTALGTFEQMGPILALVADDGQRALVAFAGDATAFTYGVQALPLSCML